MAKRKVKVLKRLTGVFTLVRKHSTLHSGIPASLPVVMMGDAEFIGMETPQALEKISRYRFFPYSSDYQVVEIYGLQHKLDQALREETGTWTGGRPYINPFQMLYITYKEAALAGRRVLCDLLRSNTSDHAKIVKHAVEELDMCPDCLDFKEDSSHTCSEIQLLEDVEGFFEAYARYPETFKQPPEISRLRTVLQSKATRLEREHRNTDVAWLAGVVDALALLQTWSAQAENVQKWALKQLDALQCQDRLHGKRLLQYLEEGVIPFIEEDKTYE